MEHVFDYFHALNERNSESIGKIYALLSALAMAFHIIIVRGFTSRSLSSNTFSWHESVSDHEQRDDVHFHLLVRFEQHESRNVHASGRQEEVDVSLRARTAWSSWIHVCCRWILSASVSNLCRALEFEYYFCHSGRLHHR